MDIGDLAAWAAIFLSFYSIHLGKKANEYTQKTSAETQKEIKAYARVLDVKNDVKKLKDLAFMYWLSEDFGSTSTALEIKILLRDIPAKAYENERLYSTISADFLLLKQLISGGEFEVINRPKLISTSKKMNDITNKLSDIFQKIDAM